MKKIIFSLFLINVLPILVFCQLNIEAGAHFTTAGNLHLVLSDMDFLCVGTLDAPGSTFYFTGSANSNIQDNGGFLTFNNITLNKSNGSQVDLHATIYINGVLKFISGNIDLGDKYIGLEDKGSFTGESESSHAFSTGNGGITAYKVLNAPNAENIGNLGAVITSGADMGTVFITRAHNIENIPTASGTSITRSYEFNPTNNSNLNATLSFKYLDAELQGLPENRLQQFERDNNFIFSLTGFSARDEANNYVTQTGYNSLSKYTLSVPDAVVPVLLSGFTAQCKTNNIALRWNTQSEINSDRFDVQRSTNGNEWVTIGSVKSTGTGGIVNAYQYDDNTLDESSAFYRLAQYDRDGVITYSAVLQSGCGTSTAISVMPNPVMAVAKIIIKSNYVDEAVLRLYNAAGQLILQKTTKLKNGTTQTDIDMTSTEAGVYNLVLTSRKMPHQSLQIIKQ